MSVDSKRERVHTTQDPWATDFETYFNVVEDMQVTERLIPSKNLPKQLDWRIVFKKGATYKPAEDYGMYGRTVDVRYGCNIHGNIFAKEKVEIESGLAAKGRKEDEFAAGRILGNVVTLGEVAIEEPDTTEKKQYGDWQPPLECRNVVKRSVCGAMLSVDLKNKTCQCPNCGEVTPYNSALEQPLYIGGNVICDSARIEAGAFIKGNVIAMNDVTIDPGSEPYSFVVVKGNIVSLEGTVKISQCYCKTVRGFKGVEVKDGVSLDVPIVMADEGAIKIEKDIYIIDPDVCGVCKGFTDYIMKRCESLATGECKKLDKLTQVDVVDYVAGDRKGQVATRTWRTFKEPEPGRLLVNIGHY